jgi:hypothetical protein
VHARAREADADGARAAATGDAGGGQVSELVQAFGEWDAPVTDDAVWIDAPTNERCVYCHDAIEADDSGAIMPNGFVQHRECSLRSALGGIGHMVDHARYCRSELGTDAGLSYRQSSRLVWRWHVDGIPVDEDELEQLRREGD